MVDGISQGAITTYTFSNVTANHTIAASFALSCTPSLSSITQTACGSYTWNGTTYTNSGDYTAHFTNSCGLDSAATLNLTINQPTSSSQTASVCSNQLPYTWNGLIFTAAGTQTKTGFVNSAGCDSSATLILSVSNTTNSITTAVNCGSYMWNGITYIASGSYNKLFTGIGGCDSIATLNLTIVSSLPAIAGANAVCVGSTTMLSNAISGGVWFTQATSQATINAATGLVTAKNAGTINIQYSKVGCGSVTKLFTINPTPIVPTITYASGTLSPQAGAPTGGFCVGKTFSVVATPNLPAGAWSATGFASITNGGLVSVIGVGAGAGAIEYTYTSADGCVNSRTMIGTGYTCASRGVSLNNEPIVISNDFIMYPNPAKGLVNLNVETLVGKGSIVVTDLYGKAVKTQSLSMGTNTVNTSNLSKGFYLVSMITNEGKTTKKLVVE